MEEIQNDHSPPAQAAKTSHNKKKPWHSYEQTG